MRRHMGSVLKGSRLYLPITLMTGTLHKPMMKSLSAGIQPCQASESSVVSHDQDRHTVIPAIFSVFMKLANP